MLTVTTFLNEGRGLRQAHEVREDSHLREFLSAAFPSLNLDDYSITVAGLPVSGKDPILSDGDLIVLAPGKIGGS